MKSQTALLLILVILTNAQYMYTGGLLIIPTTNVSISNSLSITFYSASFYTTTLYVNVQSTQNDSFQVTSSNSGNICPTSTNGCISNSIITLLPNYPFSYNSIIITNKNTNKNANIIYSITIGSGGNYGFIYPSLQSIWPTPEGSATVSWNLTNPGNGTLILNCLNNLFVTSIANVNSGSYTFNSTVITTCSSATISLCLSYSGGSYCDQYGVYISMTPFSQTSIACYGTFYNYGCNYRGKCFSYNNCTCNVAGYYGNQCQLWNCNGVPSTNSSVCNGNGLCPSLDICRCNNGYYGNNCDSWFCNGAPYNSAAACFGNGNCTSLNVCRCKPNYTGTFCSILTNTSALTYFSFLNMVIIILVLII